jgi:N utilization substance protein B
MTGDNHDERLIVRGRFAARLAAVQALYQLEREEIHPTQVIYQFINHRFQDKQDVRYTKPDVPLFQTIVTQAWENKEKIDDLITQSISKDWKLERIDAVVRALFRASVCELLGMTDVPTPVIINEYINVAKEYYADKEVAFINGVLDNISKTKLHS